MKKLQYVAAAIISVALLGLAGCTKEGGVDTAKVESAFQTASAVDKAEVQTAISAVKAGDYSSALASLQKAVANVKLTPEQKSALEDLINQVTAKVGNAVKKAGEDTSKAAQDAGNKTAGDLQKAVGK
jgi:hypothetical protein